MKQRIELIKIFFLGMGEFLSDVGMTYDNDPDSPRSTAYDMGRDFAHKLTLRKYE